MTFVQDFEIINIARIQCSCILVQLLAQDCMVYNTQNRRGYFLIIVYDISGVT
jgi:hypothetical protein